MPVPKFDIIIPAYNAEAYLSEAIDSVISQTLGDWRIILVDDGSTDNTAEIASGYQRQLKERMIIITQRNAGLPAARNAAIRAATAEFLAILDSDDVWVPNRVEESLNALEARPLAGLSYGLVTRIDETGQEIATFHGNRHHSEGRIARYVYMRQVEFPCPTVTVRRLCVEEVGVFDETMRATEDRDMWFRIATKYEVAFVPKVIAYYRTYPSSMSGDIDRMLAAQLKFIRKHYGAPGCGFISRQIAMSRAYKQRGEGLQARKRYWHAVRSSLLAVAIWPFSQDNLRSAGSVLLTCARLK